MKKDLLGWLQIAGGIIMAWFAFVAIIMLFYIPIRFAVYLMDIINAWIP